MRLLVLDARSAEGPLRNLEAQEQVYKRHLSLLLGRKRKIVDADAGSAMVARFGIEAALLHTEAHLKWLAYCRESLLAAANSTKDHPEAE